ncbi:MAG: hypothetical protein LBC46_00325 [Treponema sp.]|nr:hypothetical protein [Treponema sp.]
MRYAEIRVAVSEIGSAGQLYLDRGGGNAVVKLEKDAPSLIVKRSGRRRFARRASG